MVPAAGALRHMKSKPDELQVLLHGLIAPSKKPLYGVVLTRVLRELARSRETLGTDGLRDAAGAPSDFEALLRVLQGIAPPASAGDPLIVARIRGAGMQHRLLSEEGPPLAAQSVADLLGITRQAVNKRRKAGQLIGILAGRKRFLYPSWQFTEASVLAGLEDVLRQLKNSDPWAQARFFLSGNARLGGARPLDELRKGKLEVVRRAAQAFGEQGAA